MGGWRLPSLALVCSLLGGVAASSSVLDTILGDLANQLAGDYGYPDYADAQPDYTDMQDTVYQPEPKPAKPTGKIQALNSPYSTLFTESRFVRTQFLNRPTQSTHSPNNLFRKRDRYKRYFRLLFHLCQVTVVMSGKAGVKSSSMLPAYCDPPNPCPIGYTAQDGCIEMVQFENKAEFSRKYQAAQDCMCDTEHMFSCPDPAMDNVYKQQVRYNRLVGKIIQ